MSVSNPIHRNNPYHGNDPWKSCESWTAHPSHFTEAFWRFYMHYVPRAPKEGQRTWG